jgi:hypothetical protein
MRLYHGSNQIIDRPRVLMPTHPLDFGAGFYATTNFDQAAAFAKKVTRWRQGTPVVNVYNFDENDLTAFAVLRFAAPDAEWLRFVVANRAGKETPNRSDIVIGPVANDDVYAVVEAFEAEEYTEAEALARLKIKRLFNQVVFKTSSAIDRLRFTESKNV